MAETIAIVLMIAIGLWAVYVLDKVSNEWRPHKSPLKSEHGATSSRAGPIGQQP